MIHTYIFCYIDKEIIPQPNDQLLAMLTLKLDTHDNNTTFYRVVRKVLPIHVTVAVLR